MLLAEALEVVVPDIDPALASSSACSRVLDAGRGLGGDAVAAYIECRADPDDDRTDLLACFLSPADPRPALPRATEGGPNDGWSLAASVQRARRTSGSSLHGNSPLIWLEFDDAGSTGAATAPPSVCVCLEPSYLARNRYQVDNFDCEAMATTAAGLAAVDEATAGAVMRCIRMLPPRARAIHLSFMRARVGNTTKLYERIPLRGVTGYLEEIGWNGDQAALRGLLEWRQADDDFVHVDISIERGLVLPRLGLAFPRTDGLRFDLHIFAGLAQRALSQEAAERVMEAGSSWVRTEPGVRSGGGWTHIAHRWIDQKVVLDEGRFELKLYLAVRPLPFLLGALATAGGL